MHGLKTKFFRNWLMGFFVFSLFSINFIYFSKHETIVSSNALSFGHSDSDLSSVRYLSFSLLFSNKSYHALSNTFFVYIISLFLVIFDQILSFFQSIFMIYYVYDFCVKSISYHEFMPFVGSEIPKARF